MPNNMHNAWLVRRKSIAISPIQQSTSHKRIFKPILANSLVLFLNTTAFATTTCSSSSNGDIPLICREDGGIIDISKFLKWQKVNNANYYKAVSTATETSGQDIEQLAFQFQLTDPSLIIQSKGTGIQIGAAGAGTLSVDFNTQNNKAFTLNLSNINSSADVANYALKGNLTIEGGGENNTFTGIFGGRGINGNVTLNSTATSSLTFNDEASLTGNLTISNGTNTINFKGVNTTLQGRLTVNGGTTTINIGDTSSGATTTIKGAVNGDGTINVVFADVAQAKKLTLGGAGNKISAIILDTSSASNGNALNTLELTNGTTTVTNALTVEANQGINLNLNGTGATQIILETLSSSAGVAILNFKQGNGIFDGAINTTGSGTTKINVGDDTDTSADTISGTITGNATGASVAFGTNGSSRALTLQGTSNTLSSVTANNAGMLILDGAKNKVETTLNNPIIGEALTINLNGNSDGTQGAEFTLANNTNKIASLTLGSLEEDGSRSASKGNKLILTGGVATIGDASGVSVGANQALAFDFDSASTTQLILDDGTKALSNSGEATLNFKQGTGTFTGAINTDADGATTINVTDNAKGIITGNVGGSGTTSITFGVAPQGDIRAKFTHTAPTTSLSLKGEDNTLTSVSAHSAGTLILDATKNSVSTMISNAITGENLTIQFNGTATSAATLNLNGGTLAGIALNSGAVDENLLNLQSGTTTVTGGINVVSRGITISLVDDANLTSDLSNAANLDLTFFGDNTLTGEINTTAGTTNLNVKEGATGRITGKVKGGGATQATLEANSTLNLASNAALSSITMDSSSKLDLSNPAETYSANNTAYSFERLSATSANVVLYSEANKTKAKTDVSGKQTSDKYFTLLKIGTNSGEGLVGDNTTFTLHLDNQQYDNTYLGGAKQTGAPNNGDQYGHTYSDRIVVENGRGSGTNGEITNIKLKIIPTLSELGEISYQGGGTEKEGNIAILTIKDGIVENVESVQSTQLAGVNTQVNITSATTDITGDSSGFGYTTYFVGNARATSISEGIKEIASTTLTINYDLFLANFSSLNKRMGELRDNPYSQGVWARVYGGTMSNDFGAGSKTEYVTTQGGYDYSLTFDNARNYMGVAIAYGKSWTKSNHIQNAISNAGSGAGTGLQDFNSNMVEVGIYNSYVMDSGWYNDTIFKFDYIMSSFTMTDNTALESETNNFAMILSNEFGYRYKFGSDASWYIDPQLEIGFGYFNQSDFNRVIFDHINQQSADIKATQNAILTLRSRAGLSIGKKFKSERGFASLYVGVFYEYDYIEGGNANASSFGVINSIDSIESNGRAIVNIGSNIELSDGVRMYIDVEKSFGNKQRTDMQFNFGARYSFGEKTPTLSHQEQQKQSVAPLKIGEKKEH